MSEMRAEHEERMSTLVALHQDHEQVIRDLRESRDKHDDNFSVLIKMMDEWIRSNKKDNGAV